MTHILAVANQKGGVGKTTTCINLAASMAARGCRVLLVDMDPQGNATVGSGIRLQEGELTINECLLGEANWQDAKRATDGGYDLLPSHGRLTQAEVQLLQVPERELVLRGMLAEVPYDVVLLDCPPSLNMLTINGLMAAHGVLITMQCEYYALEGVTALLNSIQQLQQVGHKQLHIAGVLRTMYDGRNRLTQDVSQQLSEYFGDKLLSSIIPRNVRLAEAPSHGLPILAYDAKSLGAQAYLALADELLLRYSMTGRVGQTTASSRMVEEA